MRPAFLPPRAVAVGVFVLCLVTAALGRAIAAGCSPVSIGIDTSKANTSGALLLGEAVGETFVAADTLVTRFTVWRVASEDSSWQIGIHPYFVETDTTPSWCNWPACPPDGYPATGRVVWDGPTQVVKYGDGVHPIEFTWTFDPPLVLPHRGKFAWFVLQDPCAAYFDILAVDRADAYPDGIAWYTSRSHCDRLIEAYPIPNADHVFTIEFCRDASTPVRRTSWGKLKTIYR